jgi:ubiquinone/menaquinone biosynthesis C-methylase UbiE
MKQSDTWWDNQSLRGMRDKFLRDSVEGVDHPSRKYLRAWLEQHPNLCLLDIPCGPGVEYEGLQLYQTPVHYLGMDFSDTMVEIVKKKFPRADFRAGSILQIPLPDRAVDVVLCRHILEHLEDYHPAIKEAARVSKRWVILILFREPNRAERKNIGFGAWDNRLDWAELETFLRSLGFGYATKSLMYDHPVPPAVEQNTVIVIDTQASCAGNLPVSASFGI